MKRVVLDSATNTCGIPAAPAVNEVVGLNEITKKIEASGLIFWEDFEKMDESELLSLANNILQGIQKRAITSMNNEPSFVDIKYFREDIDTLEEVMRLIDSKRMKKDEEHRIDKSLKDRGLI